MLRSDYDSDITIWSHQGRIHQIEYAMEAVKQGSASVGIKSKTHVVVAGLKRASADTLGAYPQKVFRIDDHMGIGVSGLNADARVLTKYLRNECLNHKFVFDSPMPISKLVLQLADKSQIHTQKYGRRPYGVGLLVAGVDDNGTHLFETSPSGNYFDYKAQAIGARSQSARTYLEKKLDSFGDSSRDELIKHALLALRETVQSSSDGINQKNCSICVVGLGENFQILEGESLAPYLVGIEKEQEPTTNTMEE
eukprot:TRINITY_DN11529_c0_g1_i1.p1 TRINITY_DN11529_c0_g1~~TRINITY_DN11529_c0_g1_i1.p1  ORF type:complete len:252 (-),score=41.07 TRINITY_DN11529_c0_g1_i1:157-912(-)